MQFLEYYEMLLNYYLLGDQKLRSKLISQLIKEILRVLETLLRYLNETIISNFFVPLFPVWPIIVSVILDK